MPYSRVVVLVLAAWSALLLSSCGNQHAEPPVQGKVTNVSHITEASAPLEIRSIKLISTPLVRDMKIPGELAAFREVSLYPKVQGFVRSISVDRGSYVQKGQSLVEIVAPEIDAQREEASAKMESARSAVLEAQSKIQSLIAQQAEAQSNFATAQALYSRITHAARTEGAVAPYDLEQAEQKVKAAQARVESTRQLVEAARAQLNSEKGRLKAVTQALASAHQMQAYLTVRAPFDGVITERNVHEGSLVNSSTSNSPMLKVEQKNRLRLLVPVPESAVGGIKVGSLVHFTVPAFTSRKFTGTIQRLSHSLDRKTRAMMVEADVANDRGDLEPGMYPEVSWHMVAPYSTLFVPSKALASAAGKPAIFVIRAGRAEPVEVVCKQSMDDLIEVVGDFAESDVVALTGLHELKEGSPVNAQLTTIEEARLLFAKHGKAHH